MLNNQAVRHQRGGHGALATRMPNLLSGAGVVVMLSAQRYGANGPGSPWFWR
jgi:hypothetical protein